MNKLFFDIGNSFVKYASVDDGYYQAYDAVRLADLLESGLDYLDLDFTPEQVFFSSVANPQAVDELKTLIQKEWQLLAVQLTSQQSCCGLSSGYKDFTALGDDRWFAMLGCLEDELVPTIVIDAGTAITIDVISNGQHKGGFIVPGLYTMRRSLARDTAELDDFNEYQLEESDNQQGMLATDTSSAILGGTLYMAASFVNQIIEDLSAQFETEFRVVLTGGEIMQLTPLIDSETEVVPDLVLRGMVYMEESVKKA